MKSFKTPPGDLAFLSVLWIIGSVASIWLGIIKGGAVLLVPFGAIGVVTSLGIWFQWSSAKRILMAWFTIVIGIAVFQMATKGIGLRYSLKVATASYFIYTLAKWEPE
jgi:hypothetical protein